MTVTRAWARLLTEIGRWPAKTRSQLRAALARHLNATTSLLREQRNERSPR